jgi:hypothetical protein
MISIKRTWTLIAAAALFAMAGFSTHLYLKSIKGSEPFIEIEAEFIDARCDIVTRSSRSKGSGSTKFGNPQIKYRYFVDALEFSSDSVFRTKYFPYGSVGECENYIASFRSKGRFLVHVDRSNPKLSFIDKSLPQPTLEVIFAAVGFIFLVSSFKLQK